ncbi:protein mushroom body miniature [Drosophila miranda]|uniref:protein mushroom body miniature n=1 Tax=Drosophila miranda TaxID=7229 RepID=UPI00143F5BCC|nr:protein mushroom body miniature [Drosophila miranda]
MQNGQVQDKYHFYCGGPQNQEMRSRGGRGRGGANNPNFNRQIGSPSDGQSNGHHNNVNQERRRVGGGGGGGGGRGSGGGGGNQSESFSKFRDPHHHQGQDNGLRRGGGGGGGDGWRGSRRSRRSRGPRDDNRRDPQQRGGRNDNWGAPMEPTPNIVFNYEPMGLAQQPEAQPPVLGGLEVPQLPDATMNYIPLVLEAPVEQKQPAIEVKPTEPPVNFKIKKEKKDTHSPVVKPAPQPQPAKTPEESSDESSSSSSDESVEAGEVVKAPAEKTKTEVTAAKAPVSSSSSSSSEDSDSDSEDSPPAAKSKTAAKGKESSGKTSKKLKKTLSEEDVICLGSQKRHYTIPDEDEESSEVDEEKNEVEQPKANKSKSKQKADNGCAICDKKGHTSFECQMICRNCSAQYHSLKNCPKPPNLNIALQAYLEYTMQQVAVFNVEQRFAFPAGAVPAMSSAPASSTPAKSKKEKKAPKKPKKTPQKRMKLETAADDDDDDDDDEGDDEDEEEASSDSEDSEPSSDEPAPVAKQKRKRNAKQTNPAANLPPQAFPFPLLAAGSPYNSMMYPYAAPFSFPKQQ